MLDGYKVDVSSLRWEDMAPSGVLVEVVMGCRSVFLIQDHVGPDGTWTVPYEVPDEFGLMLRMSLALGPTSKEELKASLETYLQSEAESRG